MRIDRLLWFLRFTKTRTRAQKWLAEGHIRLNGERVERLDRAVTQGDILTLPLGEHVRVIEILALPSRRGPALEARACYRELDGRSAIALAGGIEEPSEGSVRP